MLTYESYRVKLPKTFLAINLSDLFSYDELERREGDQDVLEMKRLSHTGSEGIAPDQLVPAIPADGPAVDAQPARDASLDGADDVAVEQQHVQITSGDGVTDAAAMVEDAEQQQPEGVTAPPVEAVSAAAAAAPAPLGPDAAQSGPPRPSGEDAAAADEGREHVVEAGEGSSVVPPASGAPGTGESK